MENTVYLTDENDNRINSYPNMVGKIEGFEGDIWINVENVPKEISIQKGMYLHFGHYDLDIDGCYKVLLVACPGKYKVERIK